MTYISMLFTLVSAYVFSIYLFQYVPLYKQYTHYNLTLFLLSFILHDPFLNAVVFTNSMAVCISFHSILFFDRSAFRRLIQASNGTAFQWHFMSGVGHIAPVLISYFRPMAVSNNIPTPGMVSGLFHLTWAFVRHHGLIINDAYLTYPSYVWYALWCIAISSHLISDRWLMIQ